MSLLGLAHMALLFLLPSPLPSHSFIALTSFCSLQLSITNINFLSLSLPKCSAYFVLPEMYESKGRRRCRRVVRGSTRMKVKKLQTLVPGGRGLQPDLLFLRTAVYILQLRLQLNALQTLSKIYKP